MFSVAKPHGKEHKAEPGNLRSHHLFSCVSESAVHVRVPIFLVLHPVFLKYKIWCWMPAFYAKVHERWDSGINLQGLSKVTTESWYIPRVEWISVRCSIHIYRKEKLHSPNFRHNFAKPEVNHSRFLWQLGIVTSHDICLCNWVILLVVLREHAIPRCKILEALRGICGKLHSSSNQETAQMGKRHESNSERNIWTLLGSSIQETAPIKNKKWETVKELLGILFCSSKPLFLSVSMWSRLPQVVPWSRAVQLQKVRWKWYRSKFNHITEQLPLTHTSRQ